MRNWRGEEVTETEEPNQVITVWKITPHLDTSYDHCLVRGYQDAVEYAKDVLTILMDDTERELPIKVVIDRCEMTVDDYLTLQLDDDYN